MQKIPYKIYATPNGLVACEYPLRGEYISKVGTQTIDFVRGEGNDNRSARAIEMFLKRQITKAAKISRTNLNEFKAQMSADVFEAICNSNLVKIWRECPPFVIYPTFN